LKASFASLVGPDFPDVTVIRFVAFGVCSDGESGDDAFDAVFGCGDVSHFGFSF